MFNFSFVTHPLHLHLHFHKGGSFESRLCAISNRQQRTMPVVEVAGWHRANAFGPFFALDGGNLSAMVKGIAW